MNHLQELLTLFFELMQHRMTLYINVFFLMLGMAILIVGIIIYSQKKRKGPTKISKKYVVLPIIGAVLVSCETLQIAFYLLMVSVW